MPGKLFVGLLLACAAVCAQSTAQINGNVRDSGGLAVPDATVQATQTATGTIRTTASGADGSFVLPNLAIGPYTIEVAKAGFAKYLQSGIVLQVDSNPNIEAILKVGVVSDAITVEADAGMVEVRSNNIGTVIDNARVVELPLNGRDATQLIFLSGMATPGTVPQLRNFPATSVSVAGGQGNGVSYQLDGSQMNDVASSLNLPLPFPDALQEFKVETSALPPQYGFHSAATINAVTKAGTNSFHGDVFDFIRNGDFNARNFFALTRDSLKQNQWGGTIGGPILKNKLFFFAGWQQRETRSNPPSTIAFVPTPEELNGDFSIVESPFCNNGTQKNLKPIAGVPVTGNNQIPVSAIAANPVVLKILSILPAASDQCGRVTYGLLSNQNQYDSVSRVDYQINAKQSFFGRATTNVLNIPTTYDGKNPLTLNTNATSNRVYTLAVGHTYIISSNVVNTFHAAVSRTGISRTPDPFQYDWKDLGANFTDVGSGKTARFSVTSGFSIGGVNGNPGNTATGPNPQFGDDVSIVKGSHQIQFGANYIFQLMNYWSGLNATGSGTFGGGTAGTGLAMADFLAAAGNGAYSWVQGNIYRFTLRQNYFGAYAQDSWKIRHNLTMSYGVRYEPYLAVYSKYGQFMHFDMAQFQAGSKSQMFVNAPAGLTFPGDPSYTPGRSVENNKMLKFAPRVGIVWDPMGDGKMTIRAAYGIFDDRESAFSLNFIAQDPPFGGSITAVNPTIANPWINQAGGNPFPIAVTKNYAFGQNGNVVTHPLDLQPTYLQQWNLSVQRQIAKSWLLTANYLGNHTVHLLSSVQQNYGINLGQGACTLQQVIGGVVQSVAQPVCTTAGNLNLRRVTYLQNPLQGQFYSGIATVDDGATASYNALYLAAQKRVSQGFSVQANYTWSHCIGDIFDTQTGAGGAAVAGIPGNREALRSNCGTSDVRHLFNLSMVARTPKFSNRLLRMVASGWQISPIVRYQSALEFTVTSGVDNALSGVSTTGETPILVNPSGIYPANHSYANWLSKSAFATPPNGTYGNLGLNNIKGPGIFTLDMSLVRSFPILERMSLQIRAEAFNLPNHVNFYDPRAIPTTWTALNSNLFGVITTAGDPRIVQLAFKFLF